MFNIFIFANERIFITDATGTNEQTGVLGHIQNLKEEEFITLKGVLKIVSVRYAGKTKLNFDTL